MYNDYSEEKTITIGRILLLIVLFVLNNFNNNYVVIGSGVALLVLTGIWGFSKTSSSGLRKLGKICFFVLLVSLIYNIYIIFTVLKLAESIAG